MIIGHASVSTEDQSLDGQLESLKDATAERIFTEKIVRWPSARLVMDCGSAVLAERLQQELNLSVTQAQNRSGFRPRHPARHHAGQNLNPANFALAH